ncbi:MAG TPA: hypothetical protein VGJ28_20230 [Micromonosporaceae bacterium]
MSEAPLGEPATVPAGDTVPVPVERPRIRYTSGAAQVPPRTAPARDPWTDRTLSEPAGPFVAEPLRYVVDDERSRPPRRRWLLVAVAAVLLIVAGVVTYVRLRPSETVPPSQAVQQYFADLASGDITGATGLIDGAPPSGPLLGATALADPDRRPSHLSIVGSGPITVSGGRTATAVSVSYRAGTATVHQTITVLPVGTGTEEAGVGSAVQKRYRLVAPFVSLTISGSDPRPVTVNGIALPSGSTSLQAFPGDFVAMVAGTSLLASTSASATFDDTSSGALEARIALPAPEAASGAKKAVQSAVEHALTTCAASTSATPPNGCPFSYNDHSAALVWSIVTQPTVSVDVGADGTVTFSDSGHAGTVHYQATTTDWLGFSNTNQGTQTIDANGTATATTSGVTVSFGQ